MSTVAAITLLFLFFCLGYGVGWSNCNTYRDQQDSDVVRRIHIITKALRNGKINLFPIFILSISLYTHVI